MPEPKKFTEKLKEEHKERLVEIREAADSAAAPHPTNPHESAAPGDFDGATTDKLPVAEKTEAAHRLKPKPIATNRARPNQPTTQEITTPSMPAAGPSKSKPLTPSKAVRPSQEFSMQRAAGLPPSLVSSTDSAPVIQPAGFWRRAAAGAIDTALLGVITAVLTFVMVLVAGTIFNQQVPESFDAPRDFMRLVALSCCTPQHLLQSALSISVCGFASAFVTSLSPLLCIAAFIFTPPIAIAGWDPTWPHFLFAWLCVVPVVLNLLYNSFVESSDRRGSIGKQMMGIAVSGMSGERITFNRALARNALKSLSVFTVFGGHLAAGVTPKKQSLHDLLTKCLVVMRSSIISSSVADPAVPIGVNLKALKVKKMPLPALLILGVAMLVLANFGLGLPLEELRAELMMATVEKLTGSQSAMSLSAMSDLAKVYENHGKHEQAINVIRKTIVIAQEKYGPNDAQTLELERQLAQWHVDAKDWDQAEPILQRVSEAMEKRPGADAKQVAQVLLDYGICLREGQKPALAVKAFNRALIRNEKLYGPKSRQFADNLYWLACVYCENRQYAEALQVAQQAKTLYDATLGQTSLESGYARLWLGNAYVGLKDYEKGEAYLLQSNESLRRGPRGSRRRLIVRHSLANCYRDRGSYEKAEQLYEDVIKERQQFPGPNKADIYHDYAQLLLTTGRFREARDMEVRLAEELTHDVQQKAGYKKGEYFASAANLAAVYERHGKYRQAERVYRDLISYGDSNFGPEDRRLIEVRQKLAGIFFTEEKYDQAEPFYQEAIKYSQKLPDHNQTQLCENEYKLGVCLEEQGKLREAQQMMNNALALNLKQYGRLSTNVGLSYYHLGSLYCRQGNFKDAERNLLEALHIFESTVGPDDRYVGDTYIWLGNCYSGSGSQARAQGMLEHGIAILRQEDQSYKNLLVGKYFLANCLRDQGQNRKAQELYESVMSELTQNPGPIKEAVQQDYIKLMRPNIGLQHQR